MILSYKNKNDLECIENLRPGWNGYNADPISKKVIENIKLILDNLINVDIEMKIFPTEEGSIQLEWEADDKYLEIEVYETKACIYYSIKKKHNGVTINLTNYKYMNSIIEKLFGEY